MARLGRGFPVKVRFLYPAKSVAGATYEQAGAGTIPSSGDISKSASKILAGALTSVGALIKEAGKILAGSLTSAGRVLKEPGKILAGGVVPVRAFAHAGGEIFVSWEGR